MLYKPVIRQVRSSLHCALLFILSFPKSVSFVYRVVGQVIGDPIANYGTADTGAYTCNFLLQQPFPTAGNLDI